jgi:hypothetical protein
MALYVEPVLARGGEVFVDLAYRSSRCTSVRAAKAAVTRWRRRLPSIRRVIGAEILEKP